jgi:hypothetical protein
VTVDGVKVNSMLLFLSLLVCSCSAISIIQPTHFQHPGHIAYVYTPNVCMTGSNLSSFLDTLRNHVLKASTTASTNPSQMPHQTLLYNWDKPIPRPLQYCAMWESGNFQLPVHDPPMHLPALESLLPHKFNCTESPHDFCSSEFPHGIHLNELMGNAQYYPSNSLSSTQERWYDFTNIPPEVVFGMQGNSLIKNVFLRLIAWIGGIPWVTDHFAHSDMLYIANATHDYFLIAETVQKRKRFSELEIISRITERGFYLNTSILIDSNLLIKETRSHAKVLLSSFHQNLIEMGLCVRIRRNLCGGIYIKTNHQYHQYQ